MKSLYILLAASMVMGCSRNPNKTPVKQVFVHKYGMEMEQEKWNERGQHGEVVTTRKDGTIVVQHYDGGKLHGEMTCTFPHSSTLVSIEEFDQGTLVKAQQNYRTGDPKQQTVYREGRERETTRWYENGAPQSIEILQGDLLLSGEYFDLNHTLESQVQNGEGKRLVRDMEETIAAGQIVKRVTYFPTGEIESVTPYSGGKRHGELLTYYEGGLPKTIETWVHGERHGEMITFADGQKLSKCPYVHGMREGLEVIYGPEGAIAEEVSWTQDQRHGSTRYLIDGEPETTDWYYRGQLVRKHTFERLSSEFAQG